MYTDMTSLLCISFLHFLQGMYNSLSSQGVTYLEITNKSMEIVYIYFKSYSNYAKTSTFPIQILHV